MRRLCVLGLAALSLMAFTPARAALLEMVAGSGAPISLRVDQETERCNALVVVQWTDTNSQTVIRTDVRRRSTGADTFWTIRGYTTGRPDSINATLRARGRFRDGGVSTGKTYRYQARDSLSGAALTSWSDSVSITTTSGCRAS